MCNSALDKKIVSLYFMGSTLSGFFLQRQGGHPLITQLPEGVYPKDSQGRRNILILSALIVRKPQGDPDK